PERGRAEAQLQHLLNGYPGVDVQVPTGDAEVEVTGGDVRGDVARAKVEELDVVVDVGAGEVLLIGALAVSRLEQHLHGGGGEAALVRDRDAEHGQTPLEIDARVRAPARPRAVTDVGTRPRGPDPSRASAPARGRGAGRSPRRSGRRPRARRPS